MKMQNYACFDLLDTLIRYRENISEKQAELKYWSEIAKKSLTTQAMSDVRKRMDEISSAIEREIKLKTGSAPLFDKIEDPIARDIFKHRYIMGKKWSEIAKAFSYTTERGPKYVHDQALPYFEKIYLARKK